MAIAEHVREGLADAGLRAVRASRGEIELRMPNIGELAPRPYQQPELIARDPDFGRIVCFCERVTRGELDAAMDSPIPPGRPRRRAAPHARADGPLPGVLLRSAEVAAALIARRRGRR